jgi:hypothetical protein
MSLGLRYRREFNRLIAAAAAEGGRQRLVAQWPMRGMLFRNDLMVVGRAVNGWDDTAWRPSDAGTWSARERIVRTAEEESSRNPLAACPLSWVTRQWQASDTYNTARSAFWRTAKTVSDPDGRHPGDWASRLCWSNLYKVAPFAGRNPSASLRRAQRGQCLALLRLELAAFRPRRVLVMTGLDWFREFADLLELRLAPRRGYVEAVASAGGVRWVITPHPERKPDRRIALAAVRAFRSM